jgi:predicted dehydrogenase
MKKIKLIHVGLGHWGFNWARDVLADTDAARVVAYVDRDPAARERAQAELGVPASICFADLNAALSAVDSDAVLVSLPVDLHAATIEEALRAGKHVLTEKPFTPTLAEAATLIRLAEARRLLLMVSQNYRFYPATIAAARLVQSVRLGALRYVKVDFRRNSQLDGHASPGVANPLLVDMAIHHFDLMRMIIGADPFALNCTAWTLPGSSFAGLPAASLTLRFPEGIVVSYRGNWLDLSPPTAWAGEWQMDFERGSAFWTARGGNRKNLTDQDRLTVRRFGGSPIAQRIGALHRPGRAGLLAAFAKAVQTGAPPARFSSARDNIRTLAIAESALRSAARGGAEVQLADILAEAQI